MSLISLPAGGYENELPRPLARLPFLGPSRSPGERVVAEETAIAITYNRASHAVMMATPADLEDFAIGFSLSEGIIDRVEDVEDMEVVSRELGIELRLWLADGAADRHSERRRRFAGPVGCGLCGMESLEEATRPAKSVSTDFAIEAEAIVAAMAELPHLQWLNQESHAVHAAAFWQSEAGMVALREDVGRHNALDKLSGALARRGQSGAAGMVLLTSRISVEMVQKTAQLGAPILVAVSAPTALAVRTAEACGITLVAVARDDSFEIFSHPGRIRRR